MTDTTIAATQIRSIVERLERLAAEKQTIADDEKQVKLEAKSSGLDVKAIVAIVRIRKQDDAERQEADATLELYLNALGMA